MKEEYCRKCNNHNGTLDDSKWRCDDGTCIEKTQKDDGFVHCLDGSDENKSEICFLFSKIQIIFSDGYLIQAAFSLIYQNGFSL